MTATDLLVLVFGAFAVGAAILVVTSTRLVRAGLWLAVSLAAVAGMYLVLTAELVAWVQVLIYVGAVVVLLVFATMLTRAPTGFATEHDRPRVAGVLVGGGAAAGLAALMIDAYGWSEVRMPAAGGAGELGGAVFRQWVLPFEVVSVLLLAALVGAIVVSRSGGADAATPTGRFVPLARDSAVPGNGRPMSTERGQ